MLNFQEKEGRLPQKDMLDMVQKSCWNISDRWDSLNFLHDQGKSQ